MNIQIAYNVSPQRIADLMVTVIESGHYSIGYWCDGVYLEEPLVIVIESGPWYANPSLYDESITPDFKMNVIENGDGDKPITHTITRKDFIQGFELMAHKYGKHFSDSIAENEDADTADVFFQCVVLKDLIYG